MAVVPGFGSSQDLASNIATRQEIHNARHRAAAMRKTHSKFHISKTLMKK
jgi:hypothetical protein